ncbi:hypothetical protein NTE_01191 [Candidatus Nitrososphaera evergladensis SR1]|jgi:heme oxygenase|uniref:Uncharacterized protein n=1 Tax=Candidatus Nitrososphaera evergladensis SR1 TaxID=1459636 RepID=A0A075MQ11_9ARCH|nr:hypothetical protein [Candidatus Nitrososphaera evergladensis]AIF83263.1 hypothetical protein NTE_01191 [Candidatus Nitrososphaera evergladensis SR1]
MKKCAACARESGDKKYCRYHAKALEQLKSHYDSWVDAYDDGSAISWQDYLTRLQKMEEAGQWVREVIEAEMKKER